MRFDRFWMVLAALLVAAAVWTATADEPAEPTTLAPPTTAPTERLLIKVEGAGMPGTWFDHRNHDTGDCNSCHHLGRFDQKCTDCHKAQTQGEVAGAQLAFHENCYRCHVAGGASHDKAITCIDCHTE